MLVGANLYFLSAKPPSFLSHQGQFPKPPDTGYKEKSFVVIILKKNFEIIFLFFKQTHQSHLVIYEKNDVARILLTVSNQYQFKNDFNSDIKFDKSSIKY